MTKNRDFALSHFELCVSAKWILLMGHHQSVINVKAFLFHEFESVGWVRLAALGDHTNFQFHSMDCIYGLQFTVLFICNGAFRDDVPYIFMCCRISLTSDRHTHSTFSDMMKMPTHLAFDFRAIMQCSWFVVRCRCFFVNHYESWNKSLIKIPIK